MVDSSSLRKALEVVYATLLPKNFHPFIYLRCVCHFATAGAKTFYHCSILIVPENIDVNVHPTKYQVQFLHEDLVIETIQKTVEETLLSNTSSRTYYTQSLLPARSGAQSSSTVDAGSPPNIDTTKMHDYKLVRTDSKEKKLDAFMFPKPLVDGATSSGRHSTDSKEVHQKLRKPIHLTSVLSLQEEIRKNKHKGINAI